MYPNCAPHELKHENWGGNFARVCNQINSGYVVDDLLQVVNLVDHNFAQFTAGLKCTETLAFKMSGFEHYGIDRNGKGATKL